MNRWYVGQHIMHTTHNEDLNVAIIEGMKVQKEHDEKGHVIIAAVSKPSEHVRPDPEEMQTPPEENHHELIADAWDDLTGEALDPVKVQAARKLDIDYYMKM